MNLRYQLRENGATQLELEINLENPFYKNNFGLFPLVLKIELGWPVSRFNQEPATHRV